MASLKKNKKILVLGSTGMLGHVICDYLKSLGKYELVSLDRNKIDAEWDEKKIEEKINLYSPDVIINCIGLINKYANQKGMEEKAFLINSEFPHKLLRISLKNNYHLIHISTDCYLDQDVYGKSKKAGEIDSQKSLTIRTSIIGPEIKDGFGLFHWFMLQEKEANGYVYALWDGVTTLQLAKFIEDCIERFEVNGIVDYRTKESTNKFELLSLIAKIFNKRIEIKKDFRELPDKRNLKADIFCNKSYLEQLIELKDYMLSKKDRYSNYLISGVK